MATAIEVFVIVINIDIDSDINTFMDIEHAIHIVNAIGIGIRIGISIGTDIDTDIDIAIWIDIGIDVHGDSHNHINIEIDIVPDTVVDMRMEIKVSVGIGIVIGIGIDTVAVGVVNADVANEVDVHLDIDSKHASACGSKTMLLNGGQHQPRAGCFRCEPKRYT